MSIPKSHYFEARPATASRPRTVRLRLGELDLELQADRGVFGSRGIDAGTMILLREAPAPPPSGDLLDLGSEQGYRVERLKSKKGYRVLEVRPLEALRPASPGT